MDYTETGRNNSEQCQMDSPSARSGGEPVRMLKTLREANIAVNGDRQTTYGSPSECFEDIAKMWSVYLCGKTDLITSHDVAAMMALFKIARTRGSNKHRDNAVDACGYMAIFNDLLGDR